MQRITNFFYKNTNLDITYPLSIECLQRHLSKSSNLQLVLLKQNFSMRLLIIGGYSSIFSLNIISKRLQTTFDWKENSIRLGYDTCRESIIMRSKYELKKFWSLKYT